LSGLHRGLGDLAQGHDRVLVVVAVDHQRTARGDQARAVRGQQHQREAVRDLFDAIFDGDAGHGVLRYADG
jgi:hypothetical protein